MLDEFSPSLSSSRTGLKPCAPRRTMNALGRSGSFAKTMKTCACEPLVTHCFSPVRQPFSARVMSAPASEPASDSVSANAASSWPCASGGTSRSICWRVPRAMIGSVPAPVWTASVTPSPASPRESSSMTRT